MSWYPSSSWIDRQSNHKCQLHGDAIEESQRITRQWDLLSGHHDYLNQMLIVDVKIFNRISENLL